jgi:hypothetical protein
MQGSPCLKTADAADGISFLWALVTEDGLKKSNLVANCKLLTRKGQPLPNTADISTMTNFRAETSAGSWSDGAG